MAFLGSQIVLIKNGSKKHHKRSKNDNKMGAQKTAKNDEKWTKKNEDNKLLLTHVYIGLKTRDT
jgi:hypothetical protein